MRLTHADGGPLHLAYCSNVHPADDLDGIVAQLERYGAAVRERLGVERLGIGLWIGAPALAGGAPGPRLREALDRLGLEVVTLNGFPHRGFHAPVVKQDVYRPDWTDPERRRYTLGLARVLAELLPDDVTDGSISTLPLGWRIGWTAGDDIRAREELLRTADSLAELQAITGKRIRIALEPEPGCRIETVSQAAAFLGDLAPDWIGVCLDACHLAVQFEDAATALATLQAAGVPVVKAQISSALAVGDPWSGSGRELLATFNEPRYLHQVRERVGTRVAGVDDLDAALSGGLPASGEWRVHFHVPVHTAEHTTQAELEAALAVLAGGPEPATRHFEIETYTWSVLPGANGSMDGDRLVDGLAEELTWTRNRLAALGAEVPA